MTNEQNNMTSSSVQSSINKPLKLVREIEIDTSKNCELKSGILNHVSILYLVRENTPNASNVNKKNDLLILIKLKNNINSQNANHIELEVMNGINIKKSSFANIQDALQLVQNESSKLISERIEQEILNDYTKSMSDFNK